MKLGVIFPQIEIGNDPAVIRDYGQAAEELGYDHVLVFDHVLGVDPKRFGEGTRLPYDYQTPFHEPFVLFGYLAALTHRVELTTGVLVLPQRQAALVAKQAAEVDVLSGGRLRLGVGIGWNPAEFESLNENLHNRGRRVEEQIDVMRKLWTNELVDFHGKWHTLMQVGINPLPVQRPIPVWMGAMADPALERAARIADGWFPQFAPDAEGEVRIERFRESVRAAGRNVDEVGIEGRITLARSAVDQQPDLIARWREIGVSHLSYNTMGAGLNPQGHIDAIRDFKQLADG